MDTYYFIINTISHGNVRRTVKDMDGFIKLVLGLNEDPDNIGMIYNVDTDEIYSVEELTNICRIQDTKRSFELA